jgi:hypothetical protein
MGHPNFAIELDSRAASSAALVPASAGASDARANVAAQFIPAGARVLDLGGGGAGLRGILPLGCAYMDCGIGDTMSRDPGGSMSDLDTGPLPEAALGADIIVMLGLIDRMADPELLFPYLRRAGRTVVLSCTPADLAGDAAVNGANSRFGFYELTRLFDRHGFRVECSAPFGDGQMMFRIVPELRITPLQARRVAVISGGDEFGERVGRHIIGQLLPGEAHVEHITFDALDAVRGEFDLVIVGVGGGLIPPQMNEALFDVVSRGRSAIGIFGTQYRELIPRAVMERLLDRLDCWYARHEADVLMYGRGREDNVHLGDWLIDAFPLTQASDDEPLLIGANVGAGSDLAETIAYIQRHKRVFSTQGAALICALTSAETAAYSESPNGRLPGIESGEFRGLLIDIFGRTYPDKDFFLIDRDAVMRYRSSVHDKVVAMRERIATLLRAGAAVPA